MGPIIPSHLGRLVVVVTCVAVSVGPTAGAAQSVTGRGAVTVIGVSAITAGAPLEPLPFVAVDQLWTEVVHQFAAGPDCEVPDGAGGHFNVIHRTSDGPRYFKAWFLADRFVVTRYRDHPQSEPPAEKPAVAWMGVIAEDGRLRVETTVDGGAFTDVCAWLMGGDA